MLKRHKILVALLPLLAAAFVVGIVRLFELRFETGDIYPPYSSLRADPLGTKALYKSLESLPGLTVQRHLRPWHRLPDGRKATFFVFGTDVFDLSYLFEDEFAELERFMHDGGRIVFSLVPVNARTWRIGRTEARELRKQSKASRKKTDPGPDNDDEKQRKRGPAEDDEERGRMKRVSLKERWGVEFDYADLPRDETGNYQSVTVHAKAEGKLPAAVTWHTALYFPRPATNWSIVYARDDHPVLIERRFGHGSVVMSADSYFLSNEAMRRDRYPELLAWLAGGSRVVLFDETHLNVREDPGVAALVRKYRLHGLVAGLVLLAALFVWKNAVSFVPAHDDEQREGRGGLVVGKDSAAGFVNLLRRGISPAVLVSVCFNEWKKSRAHGRGDLAAKAERMAAIVAEEQGRPARERDPIKCYQLMSGVLAERK